MGNDGSRGGEKGNNNDITRFHQTKRLFSFLFYSRRTPFSPSQQHYTASKWYRSNISKGCGRRRGTKIYPFNRLRTLCN